MLSRLGVDKDPFYRIQMDLPHFPSVLLDAYNLGAKIHEIIDAVRFTMRNYPLPARTVVSNAWTSSANETEAADEEEYEEEEAEEDYDDMPGLVPVTPYNFVPAYEGRHLFLDHEEATSAVAH